MCAITWILSIFASLLMLTSASCAPSVRYSSQQAINAPTISQTQQAPQPQSHSGADENVQNSNRSSADTLIVAQARQAPPQRDYNVGGNVQTIDEPAKKSRKPLEQIIAAYLGCPYKYGGVSKKGVDCSGFVYLIYIEAFNKPLPRSSKMMWERGQPIPLSKALPGDLVFFKGGSFGAIDHVGIYMGGNRFAHSSTSRGVVYDNLRDTYYARRFAGVKRML